MWNIIKAQNYQTKNDLLVIISLLLFSMATIFSPLLNYPNLNFSDLTGSMYAVNSEKSFLFFLVLIITTRICGWDQSDKTINYEVLVGHSRGNVYTARIIASFIWIIPAYAIIFFAPTGICTAINGWGHSADFSNVMLRYLLSLLPLCRLVCEFAMMTFFVKKGGISTVLGFVIIEGVAMAESIIGSESDFSLTWQFGISNGVALWTFEDYSYGYVDGIDVVVFDTALEPSLVVGTAAASLTIGALSLLIGSVFFKKTDMK